MHPAFGMYQGAHPRTCACSFCVSRAELPRFGACRCVIEYLQRNVKKRLGWAPKHVLHRKKEIVQECNIQVAMWCCVLESKKATLAASCIANVPVHC